jgi:hypothetical protein
MRMSAGRANRIRPIHRPDVALASTLLKGTKTNVGPTEGTSRSARLFDGGSTLLPPLYETTLPTMSEPRLIVKSRTGKRVKVYADNKRAASRYDVFIATDNGRPMGPLEPGEPIAAESGGHQTSSGDATEVARDIRRFLDA